MFLRRFQGMVVENPCDFITSNESNQIAELMKEIKHHVCRAATCKGVEADISSTFDHIHIFCTWKFQGSDI